MFNVQNPPRQQHVALDGASHSVHAKRMLAAGHGIESKKRLVVGGLLRRTVSRIRSDAAIQQNAAGRLLSQGRYAGSVSWPGAAKEVDPRALKVRQGLRVDGGYYRYNRQCGISQCVDCHGVQNVRSGTPLGVAKHVVLEENACRTKTRRLKQPSKRFTPSVITKTTAKKQSRQCSHQDACCAKSGKCLSLRFHANDVAFNMKPLLTSTMLIVRRQSTASINLLKMVLSRKRLKKLRSASPCAQTAIASCITKSAS